MKHNPISKTYREPSFTNYGSSGGNNMCVQAGKLLAESFKEQGEALILKEKFGITFKEDINTTTASGAYTTMLSGTLYSAAIQNIKDILGLVFINNDLMNKGGFGAYKIPRQLPTIAYEVAEGSIVNYFDEGVDSITVTPRKVVAGTAITWEILKRGMTDFVKFVLQNAADAISRKLASDIVNGLATGAASGNTVTGGVDYEAIIDAETNVNDASYSSNSVKYGFIADKLVVATTNYGTLQKDTDWKNTVYRRGAVPGTLIMNDQPLMFGNMQVVTTPHLTGAQALILDSKKAGMLVKESDLETFEGQIPGRPYDREVVGLMSYVLAVIYSSAVAKITA